MTERNPQAMYYIPPEAMDDVFDEDGNPSLSAMNAHAVKLNDGCEAEPIVGYDEHDIIEQIAARHIPE